MRLASSTQRALTRALAAAALALLLVGIAAAMVAGRGSNAGEAPAPTQTAGEAVDTPTKSRPKRPRAPRLHAVALTPVGAHDPEGDGDENNELAAAAVDRNLTTSWRTERYSSFFKQGVGLVLDARRGTTFARVVVSTDTPGFTAEIHVGAGRAGPFRAVSSARKVSGRTVFSPRRADARYLVVWITDIPDGTAAHVTEVRGLTRR